MIELSGVRSSWLMLERNSLLISLARRSSSARLVELGIQRHHAAIGVLELGVDLLELAARLLEVGKRGQQVAVLDLHLFRQGRRHRGRQPGGELADVDLAAAARQELARSAHACRGRGRCRSRRCPSGAGCRRCPCPCRSARRSCPRGCRTGRRCPRPGRRTRRRARARCPGPRARSAVCRRGRKSPCCARSPTPRWRCASGPGGRSPAWPRACERAGGR